MLIDSNSLSQLVREQATSDVEAGRASASSVNVDGLLAKVLEGGVTTTDIVVVNELRLNAASAWTKGDVEARAHAILFQLDSAVRAVPATVRLAESYAEFNEADATAHASKYARAMVQEIDHDGEVSIGEIAAIDAAARAGKTDAERSMFALAKEYATRLRDAQLLYKR